MALRRFFARKPDDIKRMNDDPDIKAEAGVVRHLNAEDFPADHPPVDPTTANQASCPFASRLNVINQAHRSNTETASILLSIGGLPTLRRFTTRFYTLAFADPHLDTFIASHHDPHGERFALWLAEKLGGGTPWTDERCLRQLRYYVAHGHQIQSAHDRSSAHFAAWHSPKRDASVWGKHFGLDDCRLWMRLHFWAAREEGLFANAAFADYYVRFIGHFVSVYESAAPPFARDSFRWSADPANTQRYLDAGRRMPEIMGLSKQVALASLPPHERKYTGSAAGQYWPYESR